MPIEMRTLIFSRDELTEAITDHAAATGTALPDGTIMFCSVTAAPALQVTLKLVPDGQSTIETVTLGAEAVGAALVHYCIARGIPVPRRSDRSLQAMGEAVAMQFSLNQSSVKLPAFA